MDFDDKDSLSSDQKIALEKLLDWYKTLIDSNPKRYKYIKDKEIKTLKETEIVEDTKVNTQQTKAQEQSIEDILLSHAEEIVIEPYITLGGYAGTGKTTLIAHFRILLEEYFNKLNVAFCSYTGKATRVLNTKLIENSAIYPRDNISTIHGLIYSPIENSRQEIVGWERKNEIPYDLIIIDESSMISHNIWEDLLSYQVPIIAVGDHGQLPPINSEFNLMSEPHLKLEEIHRQAKDNPIIKISMQARLMGTVPLKDHGEGVKKVSKKDLDTRDFVEELLNGYNKDVLVLCGYNHTRIKLNKYIRNLLGFYNPEPQVNDRVICLRNNHAKGIFNGMLGNIYSIQTNPDNEDYYDVEIMMDGDQIPYTGTILKNQFNKTPMNFGKERKYTLDVDLFDFGYALTVHKAQGSQAKRVILFEERFTKMDQKTWNKWLYTAITRAEEELYIIGD